jgi:hypothetical protein
MKLSSGEKVKDVVLGSGSIVVVKGVKTHENHRRV